ncbi:MAG TPA: hypothetical protein DCL77_13160 [Prolixibacteraceae bacterium]|jgi:signal transduction histidine kinase/CheY-like chemotaxis protein|nr:hypothetical protein [Prolixibacteraceae bacterium]
MDVMKKLKIEIQITILTICIAIAVIVSGYLAYQSLSKIVETIHKEARPDLKLLIIKDIATDLNEVENTIRLYSLTGDTNYLHPFRQLDKTIQIKLNSLLDNAISSSEELIHIDSIRILANRKLLIWNEIRELHHSKRNAHNTFSSLYSRIDTAIIRPDTIRFVPEKKKGFFKSIFSKKDTAPHPPVIIDKIREKEIIKQEIAGIERQITDQTKQLQTKEMVLLEQNIQLTQTLNKHIASIENSEQKRLEAKTQEADSMAYNTYRGMAIFTFAAVILLLIIVIVFFRNLRRNHTYQQILKKAKAEAESLTKAKEIFVATVSHEMRTPLNSIYGLTEQMLSKTDSAEMTADLEVVFKSAEHLIALANDTLDFSKIDSQQLKNEQIDFSLDEIISEVHTLHENSAQKKGLELIVNNTAKDLVLLGDPIRLKQILINLMTNAIKFTNQGQITLTVSGQETSEQNYLLRIEVMDTGIGISKDNLPTIFEEFVQLDIDLTQKQRGAGLGLAIVKKLTLLLNGEIDVESDLGKGTRFILQIPYLKGNSDHIKKRLDEKLSIPAWFSKLHFLIVDDEEFNLYLIKNIMQKWGVPYTVAHNGREAVEFSMKQQFDLIFMDIRMPIMDGYEATKLILQHRLSAIIIALTATTKPSDIQRIQISGMHDFLHKPFTESALLSVVMQWLPEKTKEPLQELIVKSTTIDLDALERLSEGDTEFFDEMLRIFIRSSEDALLKIHQNFQSSSWIVISEVAHKLAAPAKHIQANTLYANLKKLEISNENSNPAEIKILIMDIEKDIHHINSILKQKLVLRKNTNL